MKTTDINTIFLESYFGLIRNLSPELKLDLIEKLSKTLKSSLSENQSSYKSTFGAWKSDKSADEIIAELREKRSFNRQIETL